MPISRQNATEATLEQKSPLSPANATRSGARIPGSQELQPRPFQFPGSPALSPYLGPEWQSTGRGLIGSSQPVVTLRLVLIGYQSVRKRKRSPASPGGVVAQSTTGSYTDWLAR